jgi:hypothetical protein
MPVDFRKILADSSRKLADIAASLVLEEPERSGELTELMLEEQDPVSSRAARVLAICAEKFPELFDKQQNIIIPSLHKLKSEGVIRNVLKIAADNAINLTKKNRGILLGLCFDWIGDLSMPVSIRVHAMQIIYNTSLHEAGIKDELISILEENYADGSMGFRSRADKILKKLYR